MAPPLHRAAAELDYPLYALDFDASDTNRLVVGGGGGAGRSGVGNKITVLDTAPPEELRIVADVELSRDEDSVMSLAVGPPRGSTMRLFAGVNSSPADMARGANQHLRVFAVQRPSSSSRSKAKAAIAELSRTALFANPDADTYQRLLRVAGPVGAAATAMGGEAQIALFDAAAATPRLRGLMDLPRDAQDLDLVQTGEDAFQLAFCYKYELHLVDIAKQNRDPALVFTMPDDHGERPVLRSIRYLTPRFVLAAANLPKRSGVLIQGFRLPSPGHPKARIAVTARIPRKISATALAVAPLSPLPASWAPAGNSQFVIAVAGNDSSISLYTLEHKTSTAIDLLVNLNPICTLSHVHGAGNITGLAFSRFVPPKARAGAQFIKLASISLEKTVAVHSIPLKKFVDREPRGARGPPRPAQYVVAMRSRRPSSRPLVIALALFVLVMAMAGQAVMEMYGRSEPILFAHSFLPSWHGILLSPNQQPPPASLEKLVSRLTGTKARVAGQTVVLSEARAPAGAERPAGKIQVDVHDAAVHGAAKQWDELGAEQRRLWRERLSEAGAWTQAMGESVFKGVLFGQIAGAIGDAMAG